jgi:hypothetical protein
VSCNTIYGNAAEFSTKTINQLKKDGCSEDLNHAQKVFKKTFDLDLPCEYIEFFLLNLNLFFILNDFFFNSVNFLYLKLYF